MENVNFTAFDFETAYGQKNACQLGLVIVRNGAIVDEKSFLIQPPDNVISRSCIQVHGIKPSMTKDAPTFASLWPDIKQYFEHQVVVHHSDGFDLRILNQEFEFYNIVPCRYLSGVSTMALFDSQFSRSLENISLAYDIKIEKHHDALSDARCCAQILLKYLAGLNPDYNRIPKGKIERQNDFPIRISINLSEDPSRKIQSETKIQDLSIVQNKDTVFYDKKVVISGVFERYPIRDDLGVILKNLGANINGGVSSKTNIFVIGRDSGPKKMEKVFDLNDNGYNIEIIEENQLYKLLDEINNG